MKHFLSALVAVFVFAVGAFAQNPPCPYVTVSSPDSVDSGQPLVYSANVSGGDANVTPTYNWTISAGTITSGQGTSAITVDTAGLANNAVTATVDVGGFARGCSTSASSTTSVAEGAKARMFDSTMKVNAQERFDELAFALKESPADKAYIIAYGGRKSYKGEAEASLARAKNYLIKNGGISADRIVTVDGGYREMAWRELWILPPGATPPMASPEVDPSEVIMAKPSVKKPVRKKS